MNKVFFFKFNFVFIENRFFSLTTHPDHSSSPLLFKISPNLLHLHFAQKRASLQEMTLNKIEQDTVRQRKFAKYIVDEHIDSEN